LKKICITPYFMYMEISASAIRGFRRENAQE
jgi:hypothetical protein